MGKPSLLLLSYFVPSDVGGGARMRASAWLGTLCKSHNVHLVLLGEPPEPGLRERVATLTYIEPAWNCVSNPPDPAHGSARFVWRSLARPPVGVWRLSRTELSKLGSALPVHRVDLVLGIRLSMASVGAQLIEGGFLTAKDRAFDLDDRESLVVKRTRAIVGSTQGRAVALELLLRYWRLRRWEARLFDAWGKVFVCSTGDESDLARSHRRCVFKAVPNTLSDPGLLPPKPRAARFTLLFVGSLSYAPNVDGLLWFTREIWPQVKTRIGADIAELVIVGRRAAASVRACASQAGVRLHQDVPDVVPYYADADAVIVPLRFGGGTRIKILESIALGRAVVSTALGAEGLDVTHGSEILIADTPHAFASCCEALFRNQQLVRELTRAARTIYETRFTPDAFAREVAGVLGRGRSQSDAP